ncbi:MAG: hypothetical protein ACRAVC_19470 [Trichormus sp.]
MPVNPRRSTYPHHPKTFKPLTSATAPQPNIKGKLFSSPTPLHPYTPTPLYPCVPDISVVYFHSKGLSQAGDR